MSTVAARAFKEQHPNTSLTLGLGPEFADMAPLFARHPYYDDIHVYNSYQGWPNEMDRDYLHRSRYDIVFNGFPPHREQDWWRYRHQNAEAAYMVGLPIPADISTVLTKWFSVRDDFKDAVALAAFAGFYNPGNDKRLDIETAQSIADYILSQGFRVLQLGGADEPVLRGTICLPTNYFDSVRNMLACRALIHTDTGMGHVAGAYKQRALGLYSSAYYGDQYLPAIQPINPNAIYLSALRVNDIPLKSCIYPAIDQLLS